MTAKLDPVIRLARLQTQAQLATLFASLPCLDAPSEGAEYRRTQQREASRYQREAAKLQDS